MAKSRRKSAPKQWPGTRPPASRAEFDARAQELHQRSRRRPPSILVAGLPKSAGKFLSGLLARATGYRSDLMCFLGRRTEQEYSPALLAGSIDEPHVTHQHIRATDQCLQCLEVFNIVPVVLTRNFFDTMMSLADHLTVSSMGGQDWSMAYLDGRLHELPPEERLSMAVDLFAPWWFSFYLTWKEADASDLCRPIFVDYQRATSEPLAVVRQVLERCGVERSDTGLEAALGDVQAQARKRLNLRKGSSGRSEAMPQELKDRMIRIASYYPWCDFADIGIPRSLIAERREAGALAVPAAQAPLHDESDRPRPTMWPASIIVPVRAADPEAGVWSARNVLRCHRRPLELLLCLEPGVDAESVIPPDLDGDPRIVPVPLSQAWDDARIPAEALRLISKDAVIRVSDRAVLFHGQLRIIATCLSSNRQVGVIGATIHRGASGTPHRHPALDFLEEASPALEAADQEDARPQLNLSPELPPLDGVVAVRSDILHAAGVLGDGAPPAGIHLGAMCQGLAQKGLVVARTPDVKVHVMHPEDGWHASGTDDPHWVSKRWQALAEARASWHLPRQDLPPMPPVWTDRWTEAASGSG
jgi:hypothetical protein